MISKLSSAEKEVASATWNRVFRNMNPFGWPFSSSINSGRVIFPTDGYFLAQEQFDALAKSAQKINESSCYLVMTEGLDEMSVNMSQEIYLIDFNDYLGYAGIDLPLENSLFSMTGAWGVMVSHEMHAVIGGDYDFISHYNEVDRLKYEQWEEFKEQWKGEEHGGWLKEVIAHTDLSEGN